MAFTGAARTVVARLFRLVSTTGVVLVQFGTYIVNLTIRAAPGNDNYSLSGFTWTPLGTDTTNPSIGYGTPANGTSPNALLLAGPSRSGDSSDTPLIMMTAADGGSTRTDDHTIVLTQSKLTLGTPATADGGASVILDSMFQRRVQITAPALTGAPGLLASQLTLNGGSAISGVSDFVLSANTGSISTGSTTLPLNFNPNIDGPGLALNTRAAYMLVAYYQNTTGGVAPVVGPVGATLVPGSAVVLNGLTVGDVVEMNINATLSCNAAGGGNYYMIMYKDGATTNIGLSYTAHGTSGNYTSIQGHTLYFVATAASHTIEAYYSIATGATYNMGGARWNIKVFAVK